MISFLFLLQSYRQFHPNLQSAIPKQPFPFYSNRHSNRHSCGIKKKSQAEILSSTVMFIFIEDTDSYLADSLIIPGCSPVFQNHNSLFVHNDNNFPVALSASYSSCKKYFSSILREFDRFLLKISSCGIISTL